jgi:hypothetical protein
MGNTSIAQPFETESQVELSLKDAFGEKKVIPNGSSNNEWRFRIPTEDILSIGGGFIESLDFSKFESNKFLAANIKNDTKKYQVIELGVVLQDAKGVILIAFETRTELSPNESKKVWLSRGSLPKHSIEGLKPMQGIVYCNNQEPNSKESERYLRLWEHTYQLGMAIVQNGFFETIKSGGRYKGYYYRDAGYGTKLLGVFDLDVYEKSEKIKMDLYSIADRSGYTCR